MEASAQLGAEGIAQGIVANDGERLPGQLHRAIVHGAALAATQSVDHLGHVALRLVRAAVGAGWVGEEAERALAPQLDRHDRANGERVGLVAVELRDRLALVGWEPQPSIAVVVLDAHGAGLAVAIRVRDGDDAGRKARLQHKRKGVHMHTRTHAEWSALARPDRL